MARCSQQAPGADHSFDVDDVEFNESGAMQEAALTRAEGEVSRISGVLEFLKSHQRMDHCRNVHWLTDQPLNTLSPQSLRLQFCPTSKF
jgi:hypothetical protein